jgi:transglutaminase-like putative cysteine protease
VSTSRQVALLPPLSRHEAAPRLAADTAPRERPVVRLVTFALLAAYGIERWATLERGAPTWRLIGLLALAVALVGIGPIVRRRSLTLAVAVSVLAVIAIFPLAGVPMEWVRHVRVSVTASAIGDGLSALPSVLVPYAGIDPWVRLVIALGAGVLLIDAALMLALTPRDPGGARRAAAALPLLALAVIPATIVHPKLAYAQGLILFALLAAFVWGERIERTRVAGGVALCGIAAIAALIVAPALEGHKPWLNYQALAGKLAGIHQEAFDWAQGYGPINWPRTGETVLEVKASRPDYWKAENLDLFGTRGWLLGDLPGTSDPSATISPAALARWTQTIQVTVRAMSTSQVIAAGSAGPPSELSKSYAAGQSPGTWTADGQLAPGDSYTIRTYSPHPSPTQLAAAGTDFPAQLLPGYLTIYVPGIGLSGQLQQVVFAPFGISRAAAYGPASPDAGPVLQSSPYAPAYALAQRLRRGAATPYAYVRAVESYLAHGFTYDENPLPSPYPIEDFLVNTRAGYCQQFAGAMALLLRMGGVPARVAVGFTQGNYDTATHEWLVSDLDAHAWVEAWFPGYGWVRFDPTPPADPARGGHSSISPSTGSGANTPAQHNSSHGAGSTSNPAAATGAHHGAGGSSGAVTGLAIAAAVLAALLTAGVLLTRSLPPGEAELAELERAFARSGRPLGPDATLLSLERRLAASPPAAGYVRALRESRFGTGGAAQPTRAQRRALRAQLRAGLGPLGRLQALWALPPRRGSRIH